MTRFALTPAAGLLALLLAAAAPEGARAQQQQGGEASQEERIQRLEEHLLDLNSMIGALQSLVSDRGGNSGAPTPPVAQPGGMPGGSDQRLDILETQIRALTGQIEQMNEQISRLQAVAGGGQPPGEQSLRGPFDAPRTQPPGQQGLMPPGQNDGFGQTTVQPNESGRQQAYGQQPYDGGRQDGQGAPPAQPPANSGLMPWQQERGAAVEQPQTAAVPGPDNQAAYETAYNQLLRRDYSSAEEGFRSFLRDHPNDPLAGNAQYWLGETYYVRGEFRAAADSFLAGYRNYANSDKAPANLLKLGMSLHRLGEQDAACAAFAELSDKFPNAPSHLKQRAASESERSGC